MNTTKRQNAVVVELSDLRNDLENTGMRFATLKERIDTAKRAQRQAEIAFWFLVVFMCVVYTAGVYGIIFRTTGG